MENEQPKRRRRKKQKRNYMVYLMVALTTVGLGVGVYFLIPYIFGSSPQEIQAARQSVASLYLDNRQVYLNEDFTEEKLQQADQAVKKLKGVEQSDLLRQIELANRKYALVKTLQDLYESDGLIIKGNKVSDSLTVKDGVTLDTVKQLTSNLSQYPQDELTQKVKDTYNYVKIIQDNIQAATDKVNEYVFDENDLYTSVTELLKLESEVMALEVQPLFKTALNKFQSFVKKNSELVLQAHDEGWLDPELSDKVNNSHYMSEALKGTQMEQKLLVALTFDDGPNPDITPQVLDILKKYDVKATFFVMGAYVDDYPDLARRIIAEGHQLGNHSYTHPNFDNETDEKVLQEINWTQESIRDETGVTPTLYRMPFGSGGERVVNLLAPLTSIIWNVDSEDWKSQDTPTIIDQVLNTLQQQTILLMHDTHQATADAVDQLIPILKEKGYEFVMPQDVDFDVHYY